MDNFNFYAEYYDLLYKDKDYKAEADYIDGIIKEQNPHASSVLDLGCGTGKHAYELSKKGYSITGVDISDTMLKMTDSLPENNIKFVKGDLRALKLDSTFDVIISLFHVLSYQQTNEDVLAMFNTIKKHLKPGGIFICDCWYGPGVMNDKPEVRKKELENENYKILRIAQPAIHSEDNIVDVNYTLLVSDKGTNKLIEIKELHRMRYFFMTELKLFENISELEINNYYKWLTKETPNSNSWNICFSGKIKK